VTLSQLEILVALAETGGFTTAGARLGISQSAVSHALRALERALGVPLVDRRVSPPVLTDVARRLLPHARGALAHTAALDQEVEAAKGMAAGTLRIGSFGPTSSAKLLPEMLAEFARRYPRIEVRVDEDTDEVVDQWLIERRVELGFVVLPDDRFDTVLVAEDEYVAILPEAHPLARQREVPLAALEGLPFILTGSRDEMEAVLGRARVRPRVLHRSKQVVSILGLVQQGLGVSGAPRLVLPDRYPGVAYRPLAPRVPRQVALAMRDRGDLSPVARAFVELAERQAAGRLARPARRDLPPATPAPHRPGRPTPASEPG
jgi:DNA-binding transcriptional LysR family regulator